MADPTKSIPAEEAIVRLIAADPSVVDKLMAKNVTRNWFTDPLYASVVEAAIRLRMNGKRIDPLSIMSYSSNGVKPGRWKDFIVLWQNPEPPDNDVETFLEPLQNAIWVRDVDNAMREVAELRRKNPDRVREWLPYVSNLFSGILQDAVYDPRPSSHYGNEIRDVVGKIGIPRLDRAFKGGLWSASTNLVIGISNHGKSTLAYTIAYKMVEQGIRTVFVTTEMPPAEVTIGVLRPMAGVSDRKIRMHQVDVSQHLAKIDRYLSIYDYRFSDPSELKRVVRYEGAKVVLYDYLKAPDDKPYKREDQLLAGVVEGLREMGIDTGVCTILFAQFSSTKAAEFMAKHNVASPAPFGSARVYHAADQVLIMKRHWLEPETGFFKVKKDKLPPTYITDNLLDWEFTLRHNPVTRSFFEF